MIQKWTFREANVDDYEKIAEFRKSFIKLTIDCYTSEYYYWKFIENPIKCGQLWIAESENKIVGLKSVTSKMVMAFGNLIVAGEIGDSFTIPEFRGCGIFTILSKKTREKAIEHGVKFVYNTPNNNSRPLYEKKLDHSEISSLSVQNLTRPMDYNLTLQEKYGKSLLIQIAAILLRITSDILYKFFSNDGYNDKIFVAKVSSFPKDITNLWVKESANYDMAIVRNFEYLEWRFVNSIDKYIIMVARNEMHEIQGYIVGKINKSEVYLKSGVGVIVDFLVNQKNPKIFEILLTKMLEEFTNEKVYKVSTWSINKSLYYNSLIKFGFISHSKTPVLCFNNELGSKVINGDFKWHFTIGDSDNA